jgi:methionine salvage enolase-phosphatase E1
VAALNHHSSRALFVSDVTAELDAAAGAGCQVVLSIRSGNPVQPDSDRYDVVHGFDELV